MATALDVAEYILKKKGPMTALKLQKLMYYAQAWSLVWDEKPIFKSKIEAWANGPVVPALYQKHRGQFRVGRGDIGGSPDTLTAEQKDTVDVMLNHYGDKSSQWLSDLTHAERPWKDARGDLASGERGNSTITRASMHDYYSSM